MVNLLAHPFCTYTCVFLVRLLPTAQQNIGSMIAGSCEWISVFRLINEVIRDGLEEFGNTDESSLLCTLLIV